MDNARISNFAPQTAYKVERLLDLLDEVSEHPSLKNKLALHGGTAINLFMLDVPRLSVDIDVSYVGALTREEMLADRPVVERSIVELARTQGYTVSGGEGGHAGRSFVLNYRSPWGPDHVKVDCIYLNRSPLLPVISRTTPLREGLLVQSFSDEELIGGKTKAFFDRVKMRDLYDVSRLKDLIASSSGTDAVLFHKVILFYASLSASFPHGFEQRSSRFANMQKELEDQLYPMLRHGESRPTIEELIADAEQFISSWVLPQSAAERDYLEKFAGGEYAPQLLFESEAMVKAAMASPEAQWKLENLRRMQQKHGPVSSTHRNSFKLSPD